MHPGICPEYRNAHGCFWALATGDTGNAGMTLLRIDRGVDTGPVFGYFRVDATLAESHIVIQHRVVLDHLDAIRDTLLGDRGRDRDADRHRRSQVRRAGTAVAERLLAKGDGAPRQLSTLNSQVSTLESCHVKGER